ncbi:STAG-domain-containing protein [Delitschia confertaspora ATCC 74209]|uniref:STAG-domain-containing protein n=1 Tax=Delitschia confertaspora ATCC 74209 TaxID=1513339 RepID=A0A9P4JY26_9PLEO|nr:STAG-domain-containing protein [Delitschia confertaspora ATCC 74209]
MDSSAPRRKSGRVSRKPDNFVSASSPINGAKRKRNEENDNDDADIQAAESEEEEESSEGEPDEEELKERRRKTKGKGKPAGRKPAPKKAKTNGETMNLAIRPATKAKPRKPRKAPVRKSAVAENAEGLYAEVFGGRNSLDDIAAQWVSKFHENEANAVRDVVNFVLKSAGCDVQVDEHDIVDPDSCAERLGDIQDEYQAQNVTDYPLISKGRGAAAFKHSLQGFFRALIQTIAQTGLLFENDALIETLAVWINTTSSASNRPFRHTATVASLAVVSALCEVASDIVDNVAKKSRQTDTESKKTRVNKARVAALKQEVNELNKKQETIDNIIKDWFNSVFIHRYRDVDPRIRMDCVDALADWIMTYPDKFFDAINLRYMGWILSDTNAQTRHEVVKQLHKLYQDNDKLPGLKTFTERFRSRMVEMATRDAEASVRASSVGLLDILREAGLLEPDDVDSVGRLIFDAEPKVRKAVVGFFAENVNGAYEIQIDDMGGQEALEDVVAAAEGDENYDNPRLEWLKLKCLVEQLLAYDSEEGELPSQIERVSGSNYALIAAGIESRFSLAAQALYDHIPEVKQWEVLAGYLLYDHSQTVENDESDDAEAMLRQACKLSEREEVILLEILNASVKHRLTTETEAHKDKKVKKSKAQREAEQEEQSEAARHLAVLIPRLLNKFGALPEAASSVLNLERVLNLDVFQELRQDTTLASLLDDINKQFLTHHNERVLLEASEALRHAQSHEELREVTEGRIQALWNTTMNAFNSLKSGRDFSTRGNFSDNILTGVSNTVLRIANLAKVSDCTEILDQAFAPPTNSRSKTKKNTNDDAEPPILSLIQLLDRGVPVADTEPEVDATEDALVRHAMQALLPYFMWKVVHWREHLEAGTPIPDHDITAVAERRDATVMALTRVMQNRKGSDDLRIDACFLLLDLYNMFIILREVRTRGANNRSKQTQTQGEEEVNGDWEALCQEIDAPTTQILLQILSATESQFAKRAKKHLEDPDVDDDPVDPDEDPESEDDDEDLNDENGFTQDDRAREEKKWRTLVAEQRLCELGSRMVMGVLAGTLDGKESGGKGAVRKRLERNKARLGHDWKEVVGHLDVGKMARGLKVKGKKAGGKAEPQKKDTRAPAEVYKSNEVVAEDDDEEEEEEEQRREDEDEEMVDEEQNGEPEVEENEEGERSPEVESVIGD